jgi:prolyl oligopeptidase
MPRLYYTEIKGDITADAPIIKLIDNFDAEYSYITNDGTLFYFKTNLNAPRYRIISINFASPEVTHWKEVIPHTEDVLSYAVPANHNQMILAYMQHVKHVIKVVHIIHLTCMDEN